MPGCSVPKCHIRAEKGFRLFVFPKDNDRRQLWTLLCRREDKPPTKHARICECHFEDNQFLSFSNNKKRKLKNNAIPTIFEFPLNFKKVFDYVQSKKNLSYDYSLDIKKLQNIVLNKNTAAHLNRSNNTKENCPNGIQGMEIDSDFVDIKLEPITTSDQDCDSIWDTVNKDDDLEQSSEENNLQGFSEDNFIDPKVHPSEENNLQGFSEDNFIDSKDEAESILIEAELPEEILENCSETEDNVQIESVENSSVLNLQVKVEILEMQLRKKDEELKKTKQLLMRTLRQTKRLKSLHEKYHLQISKLLK